MTEYTQEQFNQDVILFNKCCGSLEIDDQTTDEDAVGIIKGQVKIVNEELIETITALSENDMVEVLDGIVDVKFTVVWLSELVKSCKVWDEQHLGTIPVWSQLIPAMQIVDQMFDDSTMFEAMRRVAENNMSKFTTDYDVVEKWVDGVDFDVTIDSTVVDGISYFCIKDANGKIRKKADFVGVTLEDLV